MQGNVCEGSSSEIWPCSKKHEKSWGGCWTGASLSLYHEVSKINRWYHPSHIHKTANAHWSSHQKRIIHLRLHVIQPAVLHRLSDSFVYHMLGCFVAGEYITYSHFCCNRILWILARHGAVWLDQILPWSNSVCASNDYFFLSLIRSVFFFFPRKESEKRIRAVSNTVILPELYSHMQFF